jgi:hypothetical protein
MKCQQKIFIIFSRTQILHTIVQVEVHMLTHMHFSVS